MRLLTDEEVRSALELSELTSTLEAAMGSLGRHEASSSVRVRSSADGIMSSALAATWPDGNVAGGKLYATKDGVFTFVVVIFDVDGELVGLMEGDHLTRLRTAAGTGVALRHLLVAPPSIATVIGTGRQCAGHLQLLAQELPALEEVRIVGRRRSALEDAKAEASRFGLPARTTTDAAAAVEDAGLVITLTSSREPLFPADRLSPGTLICALGATKADRVEIGPDVVERAARIVVDDLTGSRTECGDLLAAEAAGVFRWDRSEELAEVVANRPATASVDGLTLFESQGVALQDVVAGGLVLRNRR